MLRPGCWGCHLWWPVVPPLARAPAAAPLAPQHRPFSTTLTRAKNPHSPRAKGGKPGARVREPQRGTKMLYLKKRPVQKVVNRTTPEERKAYRKRVVLSNPNALDVPGLPVLGQKAVALAEEEEAKEAEAEAEDINGGYNHDYGTIRVGAMVALPSGIVEQLRELRTFKPKQRWGAFRRPAVLWTDASVAIAREIARIDSQRTPSSSPSPETSTNPSTLRRIITGERGVGKSTLLLQAMSLALSRGWVVVSIPECDELTNATTDYEPLPGTNPVQYSQRTYAASLLAQVARANHDVLSRLRLSGKRAVPSALRDDPSLLRLAMLGGSDPEIAWPILDAFLDELTLPSSSLQSDDGKVDPQQRPPVLFAADGIAHFMRLSHYRDPAFNFIHAHDLALVQRFVAFLAGAQSLPNGGAVLAATSMSNVPAAPSFAHLMRQREGMLAAAAAASAADPTLGGRDPVAAAALAAATAPYVPPPLGPFVPLDARVVDAVGSVEIMRLPGLSRRETRGLLEYYAASGLLRETVDESKVSEKWTVAGGGIVGEIERAALTPKL